MSKTKKAKPALGKGLGALLPTIEFSDKGFKFKSEQEEEEFRGSIALVEVSKIGHNPYQPRRDFDGQALDDLKNSIIEHGVIQPVTITRSATGYELIAGERRLRASVAAGLKKIPAYIIELDSGIQKLEIALIENVQREDLNPIEIANGYQRLIEECRFTQEQVAVKVGKERSTVTNFLRLLKLPEKIQESLRSKEISMGHARALLALATTQKMALAWKRILGKNLSVRDTESLVRDIESGKIQLGKDGKIAKQEVKPREGKTHISPEDALVLEERENQLRHAYGTKVTIMTKSPQSGKIEFEFYSKDDLERLLDIFLNSDKSANA